MQFTETIARSYLSTPGIPTVMTSKLLLENYNVQAIIGPQKSSQATFVSDLGNKSQVPVISFTATSPTLSSGNLPYFLRATLSDNAQVSSIAALIKAYGWREVVPIYEDTDYGRGIMPYLVDALQEFGAYIPYRSAISDVNPVAWPGESNVVPKGWQIPTNGKKLRIGVLTSGYPEFIKVERDPLTNATTAIGYAVDVFEEALKQLPYAIPYEYVAFENIQGANSGSYNDFVYQVYLQVFDAAIADTTIRYNRTSYVDFTLPYTESGVALIVPVKDDRNKNMWIFLKPLTADLWFGSFAFFIYTGIVIWLLER